MQAEQNQISQTYEVCCFNHRRKKIPIHGNVPKKGKVNFSDNYEVYVSTDFYDTLRGLLDNKGFQDILNSDRKIRQERGTAVYRVSGAEYATLLSFGEISKETKNTSQITTHLLEERRHEMSEGVKNLWRILGGKRKSHKLVPRGYQTVGFGKL